jgi:predicted permease
MVAHIVIESVLMVFGITIVGYFIGKLFKEAEKED